MKVSNGKGFAWARKNEICNGRKVMGEMNCLLEVVLEEVMDE